MRIGVLALQGGVPEHLRHLRRLGIEAREVRDAADLAGLAGLIVPGGESTAIGRLLAAGGMVEPLRAFAREHAVWGTCAGMILMARRVTGGRPSLALMDVMVARNAFGRQIDSFEEPLAVGELEGSPGAPFPGVFIRAPRILGAGAAVRILARLSDGTPVAAREGRLLATAFHPELTDDLRFHAYFAEIVGRRGPGCRMPRRAGE
ncbi:MAG: pyridoxal 5'-phosphate synthase glutaminase subunit PdxT [Desulfobacterales bacterium]